jgi:hypothetical protein
LGFLFDVAAKPKNKTQQQPAGNFSNCFLGLGLFWVCRLVVQKKASRSDTIKSSVAPIDFPSTYKKSQLAREPPIANKLGLQEKHSQNDKQSTPVAMITG